MKYYTLRAVVNGSDAKLKRTLFASRSDAINYMFEYYEEHYMYSLQVEDEYPVNGDKHSIEYFCNYQNRFVITRSC